tara:strand:+ start:9564 stop:10049 length:486 start_codon:yes stop_codon:yes gene_type:complete
MSNSINTNTELMRRAIALSREKMKAGFGGPFGALIVTEGKIIAEGYNQVTSGNDPTAHAEVVAIREACQQLGTFNLEGYSIFTTCEPCPMCLSAIYWARIDQIIYANNRKDAAAIGFDDALIYHEVTLPMESRQIPSQQLLHDEALKVFSEWMSKDDRMQY